ncbi:hypothetical protein [Nonomuraea sp. SYSU D8015]|uniref:hypothetical protein n=1 Tax=Nonomuraea sp. SYSU D8015 TaxID=2593644 RepID=UPI001CB6E744|nr:hypothetical protein [Nonomuraea sp. SYSU D8015]
MSAPSPRRWTALALIATAQFIVIMDTSIIGVALPRIQEDLGFTQENLSWVFNAYVVAFGGLLLLIGSFAARIAPEIWVELTGRALQGAGTALIAPSALTLLMMLFGHDPRNSPKPSPCTAPPPRPAAPPESSLGGVITRYLSWPWVFSINIPLAVIALLANTPLMPATPTQRGTIDITGAPSPSRPTRRSRCSIRTGPSCGRKPPAARSACSTRSPSRRPARTRSCSTRARRSPAR